MKKTLLLSALAGTALTATAALAQPAAIDLGTLVYPTTSLTGVANVPAAAAVTWYQFTIPAVNRAASQYLDIYSTAGAPPLSNSDSEIGLYRADGTLVGSDDDDGVGAYTALSWGLQAPTRLTAGGTPSNGRDGATLAAGTYYMAVGAFNVTYGPTGFGATSASTATGNMNYFINLDGPLVIPPTSPAGTGSATPAAVAEGASTLLRVTVIPGGNPTSTGITVVTDLSSIGGSGAQAFNDLGLNGDLVIGDGVYSFSYIIPAATPIAAYSLPFAINDAQLRSGTGNIALSIVPPPPANDDCSTAEVIPSQGSYAFDNTDATNDGLVVCASTIRDVWFSYTPAVDELLEVNTCGTFQDTVVSIHLACGSASIACNDDSDPDCTAGSISASRISNFVASGGTTYYIRVARWLSGAGTPGVLNVIAAPTTDPTGLGNANPAAISQGGNTLLSVLVTPGVNPASTALTVTVDTSSLTGGTAAQTFYDDGSNGDVVAGDNRFSYSFTTDVGQAPSAYSLPFTIGDGEARAGFGNIAVTILPPPPANDDCGTAEVVADVGSYAFDNTAATNDGLAVCSTSSKDVWFSFTPAVGGLFDIDSCGTQDTVLSVHPDFCGSVSIACNDQGGTGCTPGSRVRNVSITDGQTVFIRVARWATSGAGAPGTMTIAVSPPSNPTATVVQTGCVLADTGGDRTVTITVIPGGNPTSTGITITVDGSALGLSSTLAFDSGISQTLTIAGGFAAGTYLLPYTVTDAESRSAFGNVAVPVVTSSGVTPATAEIPAGTPGDPLTSLSGTADPAVPQMWKINICDPANFSANASPGTTWDTTLFLFNADGTGLVMNDDFAGLVSNIDSTVVGSVAPGTYYLALSRYNVKPSGGVDPCLSAASQQIWTDSPFTGQRVPNGPLASSPITGWTGTSVAGAGAFTIALTGVCVPTSTIVPDCQSMADVASDGLDTSYTPNGSVGAEDLDAFIAGFIAENAAIADVASDGLDTTRNPNGSVGAEDLDAFIAAFIACS